MSELVPDTSSRRPPRVLLTVSGTIPAQLGDEISAGRRPRADYREMAAAMGADLLDRDAVAAMPERMIRVVGRVAGADAAMALAVHRRRRDYDVVVTDGEQIGIPLALLLRSVRRRRAPRHVMIGHLLSTRAKRAAFKLGGLHRRIDRLVVYSSTQAGVATAELGMPPAAVVQVPFMVDTAFFSPDAVTARPATRPSLCTAGLEFRDYPTLVAAIDGLDVDVLIAAASPWSKRRNELAGADLPANVQVVALDQHDLRQLYADATIVVVPLVESEFQAGITTILEAMAMRKPIVCSRTAGQVDTLEDDVTAVYVAPADPDALRIAIEALLADAPRRERLGAAARGWVCEQADIEVYARRFADLVADVVGADEAQA